MWLEAKRLGAVAFSACLFGLAGCGEGSAEAEVDSGSAEVDRRGKVVFWRIESGTATQQSCTLERGWNSLYPKPPVIQKGSSLYWTYLVSKDGLTATEQSCGTEQWYACEPRGDGLTYEIEGGVLTASSTRRVNGSGESCGIYATMSTRLEEQGATLTTLERLTFELRGSSCEALEADLKSRSINGFGLSSCVAERKTTATFSHLHAP
jgi:hypothetical protein